jgi:hypothetical protein
VLTVQLSGVAVNVEGEQVFVPGDDVTVYLVMAKPLVVVEAANDTTALVLPRVTLGLGGAVGVPGITAREDTEAGDVPIPLVAVTLKV